MRRMFCGSIDPDGEAGTGTGGGHAAENRGKERDPGHRETFPQWLIGVAASAERECTGGHVQIL